ncbi:hypothetical protein D3C77_763590 [compost metagenome]
MCPSGSTKSTGSVLASTTSAKRRLFSSACTRAVISRDTLTTSTTAPVYVSRMARLAVSNQR